MGDDDVAVDNDDDNDDNDENAENRTDNVHENHEHFNDDHLQHDPQPTKVNLELVYASLS